MLEAVGAGRIGAWNCPRGGLHWQSRCFDDMLDSDQKLLHPSI